MMGVGAKRALGLYRSCAPRHCFALFLIVSSQEPEAPLEPADCDSRKGVPVDETSPMRRKAFCNNE